MDDEAGFGRQRRNLFAISLFIIFYKTAGLKINEINFLGNTTTIENPSVVSFSLIIFFIYFLWRYYSACREVGGISLFFGAIQSRTEKKAELYVRKKYHQMYGSQPRRVDLIERGKNLIFQAIGDRYNDKSRMYDTAELSISLRYRTYFLKCLSIFPTIVNTSKFSEYILPYIIALFALLEFLGVGVTEFAIESASAFKK